MQDYNKLLNIQNNSDLPNDVRYDAGFKVDTFFAQTQANMEEFFAKVDKLIEGLKSERNL